jgi:signal transduction histidine kinase/CheY-like chemotaxis protein
MEWLPQGDSRGRKSLHPSGGREPNASVLIETAGETAHALRVLTATVVLLPILLFVVAAFVDRSAVLRRAQEDGRKTVALLHEQAANLYGGHEIILDTIVERVRNLSWDAIASSENLLRDLETMDNRLDEVSEIVLADVDARVRLTTVHGATAAAMLLADRECFLWLGKGNPGTCISHPYIDAETGGHLFSLCRRLEDGAGAFKGVAQVAISADYFIELWGAVVPNVTDTVVLARSDGIVLARYPKSRSEAVGLPVEEPFLSGIRRGIEGVITGRSSADNVDRIAVYKKIAGYSAYVGVGLDKNAALGEWHQNLLVYGAVSLAATLALMSAAGMVLRRARRERRAVALWQAEVKERENAQAQLLQSQKMESIGQLTGGVAHDFNNLLTVILGNIDLALDFERDDRGAKLLEGALNAGERAAVLTKRLLAFARQQDLQPMPVDLKRLIDEIEDMLIRTLGPAIRLSVSGEPGLWPAHVDRSQIELIILNLAINARDAMPRGGSIDIALSNRKFSEGAPADLAAGEYVVLTLSDTGEGMDEATLARAFEPFFTTKDVGKGTGLGLSMVHGTVVQSGGAARIRSKPAQGTSMEIWLPRSQEVPMEAQAAEATSAPEQGIGTIVVCDDDPSVRKFMTEALGNSGYRTIATTDGPSALAVLDADTPVDLLLVDLAMPEMDGATVARLAQSRRPGLPMLIVTGYADQKEVEAEASGVPVLRKPFKRSQLAARIAELLKESRAQDRTAH